MRDLKQIDADLTSERAILVLERRAGEHAPPVAETVARIDALLDERSDVVLALRGGSPGAVDARLVQG